MFPFLSSRPMRARVPIAEKAESLMWVLWSGDPLHFLNIGHPAADSVGCVPLY